MSLSTYPNPEKGCEGDASPNAPFDLGEPALRKSSSSSELGKPPIMMAGNKNGDPVNETLGDTLFGGLNDIASDLNSQRGDEDKVGGDDEYGGQRCY